jgi:hypothetical protein
MARKGAAAQRQKEQFRKNQKAEVRKLKLKSLGTISLFYSSQRRSDAKANRTV